MKSALRTRVDDREGGRRPPRRFRGRASARRFRTARSGQCCFHPAPWRKHRGGAGKRWHRDRASYPRRVALRTKSVTRSTCQASDAKTAAIVKPHLTLGDKLGRFAAQLAPNRNDRIVITYGGKAVELPADDAITRSILTGFLKHTGGEEVNSVNVRSVATARGIAVEEVRSTEQTDFNEWLHVAVWSGSAKRLHRRHLFRSEERTADRSRQRQACRSDAQRGSFLCSKITTSPASSEESERFLERITSILPA